jgi:8-oxo-dGTP pyrophosphatase MutT (NUDIX family)
MMTRETTNLPPATPAATLVLFRDRAGAPPELLMVERSGDMRFAAGAVVFPGGKVDEHDHEIAAGMIDTPGLAGLEEIEIAARVAAVRETIEESGIAIGLAEHPDSAAMADFRTRLGKGELFAAILADHGFSLDLSGILPFARWRPGFREARIFDARFYIAHVPDDAPEPIVDATENVRAFWASASDVLAAADAARVRIIYPTRRNLERLAQFADFAGAAAHVDNYPVELITPYIEERGGVPHLCIPDTAGYPVTSEPLENVQSGFVRP